jgi:hypothetical protein
MELINLNHKDVKYSINEDGTLIVKIKDQFLLKISWGELRSLDMIVSKQQSEALGLAKSFIEKLEKNLDKPDEPTTTFSTLIKDNFSFFENKEDKERFSKYLTSYIDEDDPISIFEIEELEKVLGKEFTINGLREEFGNEYYFKEIGNNRISIAINQ